MVFFRVRGAVAKQRYRFTLVNFAKSDSLLYLNSFVLLAFIYAVNFKSLVYENKNAK